MRAILQDAYFTLRSMPRSAGFTLVAVLTLSLGISVSTAVFSWIDSVLLHPIPGTSESDRLVAFESLAANGEPFMTSYRDYRDYSDNLKLVSGLALAQGRAMGMGEDTNPERVWGELVSGNYFEVLGVKPVRGRVFSPDEYGEKPGGYPVAVIGEKLWQRSFQSDPGIVGRTIRINRQPLTVIGVVPSRFRGTMPGLEYELWIPAVMGSQLSLMPDWYLKDRKTRSFLVTARLQPGTTVEQASAEIAAMSQQLAAAHPATNQGMSATVLPVWKAHYGAQNALLSPLRILMGVCAVVLLVACANVANLMLARTASRQTEFSLRTALGASRLRLIGQLLTESMALALLAMAVSLPLSLWMTESLGLLLPPGPLPISQEFNLNADILLFAAVASVVSCLFAGIVPAILGSRGDLSDVLKEGSRSGTGGGRSGRVRGALVVSEVALALVAIIGAGLFSKSFQVARQIEPGFDQRGVLVSQLSLSSAGYGLSERLLFCQRLKERLVSQPGVTDVAYTDFVPMGYDRGSWEDLQIEGFVPAPNENMKIYRSVTSPGYFSALKIPLLDGRDFTDQDDSKALPVIIVNEAFGRRFLPGLNPLGRRVRGWGRWFTIIGVAKDSKYQTPTENAQPFFYVPFKQVYRTDMALLFLTRTAGDPLPAASVIRNQTAQIDPAVSVYSSMPMTEFIGAALFPLKVGAMLLSFLGAVALLLAAAGLYSVMAYSVAQRSKEIGLRMALGADRGKVLSLMIRQAMRLTVVGLVAGTLAATAGTKIISGVLVGVSSTDPLVFGASAMFLALVALVASFIPAMRAASIDPGEALRR